MSKISIILPTLNSMRFLKERMESVLSQTLTDWELIAVDSFSEDGTFEYLQALAEKNSRIRLHQVPRGLYQAWNFGIRQAKGTYVYIATSDDLMSNDCLEKMYAALEEHPECDLCDSLLSLIDAAGNVIKEDSIEFIPHYWHVDFPREKKHIRYAPHDWLLHYSGKTVYTSIAQLLVRRSLFEKTGLFPENMGSSADYLWGLRASYHANVIFLPERLSFWRIHSGQATGHDASFLNFRLMNEMAAISLKECHDEKLSRTAKRLSSIVSFKGILLPLKRTPESGGLLRCVLRAGCRYPVKSLIFFLFFIGYNFLHHRHHSAIASYDALFLWELRNLKLQSFIAVLEKSPD